MHKKEGFRKVSIKEVQKILGVSTTTAWRMIRACRDALEKNKPQILSLTDFKKYYGLD